MILVDTSIWIDHLRSGDDRLTAMLRAGRVLSHPFVVGELAIGNLANRTEILHLMSSLPRATEASADEVLAFIAARHLFGRGIGYVDAALLAATALTPSATMWSRDRRLTLTAQHLGVATPAAG